MKLFTKLSVSASLLLLLATNALRAQEKQPIVWPEEGKYRVDTIYNKPYPYNLFVNVFACAEGDLFGGAAGAGIGAYARYTVAKRFMVAATYIGMPGAFIPNADVRANYDYHYVEARAVIPFKRSKEPQAVSKKLYSYYYYDGVNRYKRTYSANFNVMASTYLALTGSVSQSHRYYFQKFDTAGRSFKIYDVTSGNQNQVYKRAQIGFSTFTWSAGIFYSTGMKFKGKAFATLEGHHRKKTVRAKSIIDLAAEVLVGTTIADEKPTGIFESGTWKYDTAIVNRYALIGGKGAVNKKNLGWRFQINMKKGIIGYRVEMGVKPGIDFDYSNNNAKVENEWLVKRMNRAYLNMGIGIAIGAL